MRDVWECAVGNGVLGWQSAGQMALPVGKQSVIWTDLQDRVVVATRGT